MRKSVFVKTESGVQEIQTREMRLPPRVRALLVQVDGKRSVASLLSMLGDAGITEAHFEQLEALGLIVSRSEGTTSEVATEVPTLLATEAPPADAAGTVVGPADRLLALYRLCNEAISTSLGLRGFKLLLQLERASSLEDYERLSEVMLPAIRKARGEEAANALELRVRALLA